MLYPSFVYSENFMKLSIHKNLSEGMQYGEYADIAYMTGNKR